MRAALFGMFLLLYGLAPAWGVLTPLGGPVALLDHPGCWEEDPDIAALPGGGFVAVWMEPSSGWVEMQVMARVFGPDGLPVAPPRRVAWTAHVRLSQPVVAVDAAGTVLIAWYNTYLDKVRFGLFDEGLEPLLEEKSLARASTLLGLDAAAPRNGGFALIVSDPLGLAVWRLGADGESLGSQPLGEAAPWAVSAPRLIPDGGSGLAAVWSVSEQRSTTIRAQRLTSGATPVLTVGINPEPASIWARYPPLPGIASSASGTFLIAWRGLVQNDPAVLVRVFDGEGRFLTEPLRLDDPEQSFLSAPEVVADSTGGFIVLWQNASPTGGLSGPPAFSFQRLSAQGEVEGETQRFLTSLATIERPEAVIDAQDRLTVAWGSTDSGDQLGFECPHHGDPSAWRFDVSAGPLKLQGGRFEVRARWTDHAGNTGEGTGVAVTGDSGSLWFFDPDNVELMVKVLDGRPVNGHFWVFYASLSDVAYTLTVTDRVTGETKTYENPAGRLASHADTSAFSAPPVEGAKVLAGNSATPRTDVASSAGPCSDPSLPVVPRPGLCLGGRFEVEVDWSDPVAGTGTGQGVRLTGDSGYLWFFAESNIELVVKVLDGRPVNGHFWVFYGALSDVEYTILVRDTVTGAERTYRNPAGQLASRADTAAF